MEQLLFLPYRTKKNIRVRRRRRKVTLINKKVVMRKSIEVIIILATAEVSVLLRPNTRGRSYIHTYTHTCAYTLKYFCFKLILESINSNVVWKNP